MNESTPVKPFMFERADEQPVNTVRPFPRSQDIHRVQHAPETLATYDELLASLPLREAAKIDNLFAQVEEPTPVVEQPPEAELPVDEPSAKGRLKRAFLRARVALHDPINAITSSKAYEKTAGIRRHKIVAGVAAVTAMVGTGVLIYKVQGGHEIANHAHQASQASNSLARANQRLHEAGASDSIIKAIDKRPQDFKTMVDGIVKNRQQHPGITDSQLTEQWERFTATTGKH